MVLKRKRSDSEISTSSSLLSSPTSAANYMSIDSPQPHISTPSLFASRTRKRHRDNRPSEAEVHQHTLSMLYSAQQHLQPQSQTPSPPVFQSQTPISSLPTSSQACQQSSLHSFWALPSSSTRQSSPSSTFSNSSADTPATNTSMNAFFPATNCEDCNAALNGGNGDAMDVDMMDVDMDGGNYACMACGKQVCHGCSVSNLGADRRCLGCAKPKKVWVGGLGWMDQ